MSLSVGDILDDYIDSLANVSSEIDQNLTQLRRMDEDFKQCRETYTQQKQPYIKMICNNTTTNTLLAGTSANSPSTPSPAATLSWAQIDSDYKIALHKQDQKIDLARQMYDLLSRSIERIDSQMAQNNISLTGTDIGIKHTHHQQIRNQHSNGNHRLVLSTRGPAHQGNARTQNATAANHHQSTPPHEPTLDFRNPPKQEERPSDGNRNRSLALLQGATSPRRRTHHSSRPNPVMNTGALLEHAIDPNEPRYCYCNQVSFGDMVACDGENCDKEWFHYACVGLTETPPGKWFCKDCSMEDSYQKKLKRCL
ncbi:hypothetical protein [Absidia glauca]|uniref:Chromatin modification-related protein n=1 Tax=Absidia glauca TaxID=4829 RepID=A0A168MCY0_ABSGL|nr:hypothetical protein [Absidia glauca]